VDELSFVPLGYRSGVSKGPGLWSRALHKLGYPIDITGFNRRLRGMVDDRTDVLWVEKAPSLRPGVLRRIRRDHSGVSMVFFSEDDMYARHNQSAWFRACLPLYDVVFTTKSFNCDPGELPAMGARRVVFVDKAYDRNTHRPMDLTGDERRQLGADVGFIGTFETQRAERMLFLARNGVQVRIFGNGWSGWVGRHPNLLVENRPVLGDDYARAICATRINLCFLRKINRDLQTDRTPEIPACGAFMLAERTVEHSRLFAEDREAAYFDIDEPQDLLDKVRWYLEHEDRRAAVAAAGRERCLRDGYSHHDRLQWMLAEVAGGGA